MKDREGANHEDDDDVVGNIITMITDDNNDTNNDDDEINAVTTVFVLSGGYECARSLGLRCRQSNPMNVYMHSA